MRFKYGTIEEEFLAIIYCIFRIIAFWKALSIELPTFGYIHEGTKPNPTTSIFAGLSTEAAQTYESIFFSSHLFLEEFTNVPSRPDDHDQHDSMS